MVPHTATMMMPPPLSIPAPPPEVALDSQVRGLKTALVEADDFSAG